MDLKVLFDQDAAVVFGVASDHVGEGADGDAVVADGADAGPGFGGEGVDHGHGAGADGFEFVDVAGPGAIGGAGGGGEIVLLEGWERDFTGAAGDPEEAVGEDAFGVVDVAEGFAQRPFPGFVAVEGLLFVDAGEEGNKFAGLGVQVREDIFSIHLVDVVEVVFGGFGTCRFSGHFPTITQPENTDSNSGLPKPEADRAAGRWKGPKL